MKMQSMKIWSVAAVMELAMFTAAATQAAIVTRFNFDHGVQNPATESPYVAGTGEVLSGATYTLSGTAGEFRNSPVGDGSGSGQSWYNENKSGFQGYLTTDHPDVFDSITLEARVYQTQSDPGVGSYIFRSAGAFADGQLDFFIRPDGTVHFSILAVGSDVLLSPSALALNQWNHIAAVYDDAANEKRLYVNGTLVASAAFVTTSLKVVDNGSSIFIGSRGSADRNFNGYIDEIVLSDTVLAPGSFVLEAIPEPASLGLLATGSLLMLRRRICRR